MLLGVDEARLLLLTPNAKFLKATWSGFYVSMVIWLQNHEKIIRSTLFLGEARTKT